jgi:hypothetical protein
LNGNNIDITSDINTDINNNAPNKLSANPRQNKASTWNTYTGEETLIAIHRVKRGCNKGKVFKR